jgi:hypothetical protein
MIRHYNGWEVYDNGKGFHPTTGRFMAYRFGVRIGANTESMLISMIDQKRIDDNNYYRRGMFT